MIQTDLGSLIRIWITPKRTQALSKHDNVECRPGLVNSLNINQAIRDSASPTHLELSIDQSTLSHYTVEERLGDVLSTQWLLNMKIFK